MTISRLTEDILNETQIKAGLSLSEDDHTVTLYHRNRPIKRYSTEGLMSRDEIIRDADEFIARRIGFK